VPPEPVKVKLLPLQIVSEGEAVIVAEGIGLTVTVEVAVPEQPFVVAVKVYPVLVVGDTVIAAVAAPPGFHEYVVPPDPVKVKLLPLQIVSEGEAVIVAEGIGLTVTVEVA